MAGDAGAPAVEVVESFRALLDNATRETIGEQRFQALEGMVREAIAEQSEAILQRLDRDLKQLRSELVERRPFEL